MLTWAWILVWTSVGIFFVVLISTMTLIVVRGLQLWRRIAALEESVGMPLEELMMRVDTLNTRAEEASNRAADAEQRVAELREALDRVGVLSWALGDARDALGVWRSITRR